MNPIPNPRENEDGHSESGDELIDIEFTPSPSPAPSDMLVDIEEQQEDIPVEFQPVLVEQSQEMNLANPDFEDFFIPYVVGENIARSLELAERAIRQLEEELAENNEVVVPELEEAQGEGFGEDQ